MRRTRALPDKRRGVLPLQYQLAKESLFCRVAATPDPAYRAALSGQSDSSVRRPAQAQRRRAPGRGYDAAFLPGGG
ncbi:hypothetical protein CWM61_00005, partial [Klebsiella sp. K-Nf6]